MPRENKKRGRRAEASKRKADDIADIAAGEADASAKRQRRSPPREHLPFDDVNGFRDAQAAGQAGGDSEMPFYGLLDEQESEYFRRADDMLEANDFSDEEERSLFLENVYKEVDSKELKLACSQSSSRLLERLILLSTPAQLKKLFQKFSGHFLNLVQHRFASHCCETLFKQSSAVVTSEVLDPSSIDSAVDTAEPVVSMENLFLMAITELQGNLGFLMTDRFGAHALRVLLVVLSGQPFEESNQKSLLASKKKENIDVGKTDKDKEPENTRPVPEAFTTSLEKTMNDSVAGLETAFLRTLATHPIGNPSLQLLIRIELTHFGKQRAKEDTSIVKQLLPDDPLVEGTESAAFINNLTYDAIGSRLLETIIEFAPGKMFKHLYKEFFRDRMGSLARNEVAAYIVAKIIERLSSEDLAKAVELILPQVPSLAERGRTSLVRTIIERCCARGVDTAALATTIHNCWADDAHPTDLSLAKMLQIAPSEVASIPIPQNLPPQELITPPSPTQIALAAPPTQTLPTNAAMLHSSLLAQTMLKTPGPTSALINTAISNMPDPLCLRLAFTPILSPILQTSLTVPAAPLIFRRKLIKRFYSHICALALDPAGSHLVDAIWAGTQGMAFARERIAEELAESEQLLRESRWGRMVWRNWKMDLYRRRRREWVRSVRGEVGNDGFLSFPGGSGDEALGAGHATNRSERGTKGKKEKDLTPGEVGAVRKNGGASAVKLGGSAKVGGEVPSVPHASGAPVLRQPVNRRQAHQLQQDNNATAAAAGKRPLDQARERFMRNREKKEREAAGRRAEGSSGDA